MPHHPREEVTDLIPFAADDDLADQGLDATVAKQSAKPTEDDDADPDEEQDDPDLGDEDDDEDLEEEEDDGDEDLDADPAEIEAKRSKAEEEKAKALLKNPLPPKADVPEELLDAWEALDAGRRSMNKAFTTKTQEVSKLKTDLGEIATLREEIAGMGGDFEEFIGGVREVVTKAKENGGDLAAAVAATSGTSSTGLSKVSETDAIMADEELDTLAAQLQDADNLPDAVLDALTKAYRSREALVKVAVADHNRKVDEAIAGQGKQRADALTALKADPRLGKFAERNAELILKEANKHGVRDLTLVAKALDYENAYKRGKLDGRKRLQVSRQKNLDVGAGGTGDYDIRETSDRDLDRGFEEGGLAGMVAASRKTLTGGKKSRR